MNGTIERVTIRPIPSQYTAGAWATIRATFHWRFPGGRVTAQEEGAAMAAAHRMAADLIEATPPGARWCLPQVELITSYSDTVQTAVVVELAHGTEAEKDAALGLFHDVIPPPMG